MAYGYVSSSGDVVRLTRTQDFRPTRDKARLSIDDIHEICEQVAESMIDPVLSVLGVSLPISASAAPSAWQVLANLNILGAACQIDQVVFTEVGVSEKGGRPWTCDAFDKRLEDLAAGKIDLVDAGLTTLDQALGEFGYTEDRYFSGRDDDF